MKSKEIRSEQTFLRNEFDACGSWNIPIVRKNKLDLDTVDLICFADIKANDTNENTKKGVHFFIDDYRMDNVYANYEKVLPRLRQYRFILTPDYSLYKDLPRAIQVYNVFRNRWCGAYWQKQGLTVIPTISWSDAPSYDFCFSGVEKGSIVAIGMIGCKRGCKTAFMRGYNAMLERIEPQAVICLGTPFQEMTGNIISIDYMTTRRVDRNGR